MSQSLTFHRIFPHSEWVQTPSCCPCSSPVCPWFRESCTPASALHSQNWWSRWLRWAPPGICLPQKLRNWWWALWVGTASCWCESVPNRLLLWFRRSSSSREFYSWPWVQSLAERPLSSDIPHSPKGHKSIHPRTLPGCFYHLRCSESQCKWLLFLKICSHAWPAASN